MSSIFIGYCIYFDRKRRADPDYKKKVLASESTYKGWRVSIAPRLARKKGSYQKVGENDRSAGPQSKRRIFGFRENDG